MIHDKNRQEYAELIAALVDNEIKDSRLRAELEGLRASDPDLMIEFEIQAMVKSTVTRKCSHSGCPAALKNRILADIKKGQLASRSNGESKVFTLRPYAYAAAIAVVFITLFIFKYTDSGNITNLPVVKSSLLSFDKMAMKNFRAILDSKLAPQIASSDTNTLKSFFTSKGLDYDMHMICPQGWEYVGAVVSTDNGKKFGHVVLKDTKGKLIYIFEVDKKYLTNDKKLDLDDKIMSQVMSGSCYMQDQDDMGILINKTGDNVRAIVTNDKCEKLKSLFCGL